MIHLGGVLGLPGLLSNVGHGVIIGVFNGDFSVLGNDITWVYILIINHHYVGYCFYP